MLRGSMVNMQISYQQIRLIGFSSTREVFHSTYFGHFPLMSKGERRLCVCRCLLVLSKHQSGFHQFQSGWLLELCLMCCPWWKPIWERYTLCKIHYNMMVMELIQITGVLVQILQSIWKRIRNSILGCMKSLNF